MNMIPNLQVIIIGEGEERKNLSWLAKRMELDRIIWFVGRQEYVRKWLNGFDVYIAINEETKLFDLEMILEAMLCRLPVIGFSGRGIEDLVKEKETGFILPGADADALAQMLINLEQDYIYRSNIGKRAEKMVADDFSRQKQIDSIKSIIDNL
ncbi:glycosyltransferase [Candidatus Falkowbacteria bacterium]|nr:glycosyltransferase [Candidatus Falkowbacteria bacterium]